MMLQEFEAMTGIYPDAILYAEIELAYYGFKGSKGDFCKAYKANTDGLAERIQYAANSTRETERQADKLTMDARDAELELAKDEIKRLHEQLEREQEWTPYEDPHNVKQSDYEALATSSSARALTDEEAADLIASEFGFDRSKIKIIREVPREEISRHRRIRKVGQIERLPYYDATDWNYARFDVSGRAYEMENGELRQFWS